WSSSNSTNSVFAFFMHTSSFASDFVCTGAIVGVQNQARRKMLCTAYQQRRPHGRAGPSHAAWQSECMRAKKIASLSLLGILEREGAGGFDCLRARVNDTVHAQMLA